MSGIFEHLAATDDSERIASRKAVAVANKRVKDKFGAFLSSAKGEELAARLSLVDDEIVHTVQSVVDEYGGDRDRIFEAVTADWKALERGENGRWVSPGGEAPADGDGVDIDSELPEAPSAVGEDSGEGTLSHQGADKKEFPWDKDKDDDDDEDSEKSDDDNDDDDKKESATHTSDADRDGGGAVKREDLPKGDESGLGGPSPKIDKGKSGDNTGWNLDDIDTETSGTPHPTVDQDIKDKPDHKKDFLEQTDAVTEEQTLPTGDDDAESTERNIEQPATDTWSTAENDPVTGETAEAVLSAKQGAPWGVTDIPSISPPCESCGRPETSGETVYRHGHHVCQDCARGMTQPARGEDLGGDFTEGDLYPRGGSVDPDKNPIAENLRRWEEEQQVQTAIARYEAAVPLDRHNSSSDDDDDDEVESGKAIDCPGCGEPVKTTWQTCPDCGHELDSNSKTAAPYEDHGYGGGDPDDEFDDRRMFADPGGNSALRAEGPGNLRNRPCPNCKTPNVLTPEDEAHGYQCDRCADAAEGTGYGMGEY